MLQEAALMAFDDGRICTEDVNLDGRIHIERTPDKDGLTSADGTVLY